MYGLWDIKDDSSVNFETKLLSESSKWHVSFSSSSPLKALNSPIVSFESENIKVSSPLEQAISLGQAAEIDLTDGYLIHFNRNSPLENWQLIEAASTTQLNTQSSHELVELSWNFSSPSVFETPSLQEVQVGLKPWKSLLASALVFNSNLEIVIEGLPNKTYRVILLSASSDVALSNGQSFVVDIFKNDIYQRITGFIETKRHEGQETTGIESFAQAEFEAPVGDGSLRFTLTSETEQPIIINAIMLVSY